MKIGVWDNFGPGIQIGHFFHDFLMLLHPNFPIKYLLLFPSAHCTGDPTS